MEISSAIRGNLNDIRRAEARLLISDTVKEYDDQEARINTGKKKLAELEAKMQPLMDSDAEQKAMAKFQDDRAAWLAQSLKIVEEVRKGEEGKPKAVALYKKESAVAFNAALADIHRDQRRQLQGRCRRLASAQVVASTPASRSSAPSSSRCWPA